MLDQIDDAYEWAELTLPAGLSGTAGIFQRTETCAGILLRNLTISAVARPSAKALNLTALQRRECWRLGGFSDPESARRFLHRPRSPIFTTSAICAIEAHARGSGSLVCARRLNRRNSR